MGVFDRFKKKDINANLRVFKSQTKAILIDVRARNEYELGHVPRSRNIPLDILEKSESSLPDKQVPIFIYAEKDGKAKKAADFLKKAGYENVFDIGSFETFTGKVEKGSGRSKNPMAGVSVDRMRKEQPWTKDMKMQV